MTQRIALVTAAGSDFGVWTAEALRGTCDRLIVAMAAPDPALEARFDALGAERIVFDDTDAAAWDALSAELIAAHGGVDILVHCAPTSTAAAIVPALRAPWLAARESVRLLRDSASATMLVQVLAPADGDPLRAAVLESSRLTIAAALIDAMGMERHPHVNRLILDPAADRAQVIAAVSLLAGEQGSFFTGAEIALDATAIADATTDLTGKTLLITGATSGIGRAIAIEVGARGGFACVGGRKPALAEETLEMVRAAGGDGMVVPLDVTDAAAWQRAIALIEDRRGALHGLVNNAGESRNRRFDLLTQDDIDFLLRINVEGPVLGIEAAWDLMTRSGGGSIINISSVAGVRAGPGAAAYAATKAATIGMSKAWGRDTAGQTPRIRVNSVEPGLIWSDSVADSLGEAGAAAFRAKIEPKTPLGRVGLPEEIARPVAYLLSDAAAAVTGQAIDVSGGLELAFP